MTRLPIPSGPGRTRLVEFALFFAGVLLVVAGVVVGIWAIHWEFVHAKTHEVAPNDVGELVAYEELSPRERRLVRGAIDGTRYTFSSQGPLPRGERVAATGTLTVRYRGRYYQFARRPFFNYETAPGVTALLLVGSGLGLVGDAIARDVKRGP